MVAPIRMKLSRRKGFDLQTLSRKFNGLDAVNVARPGQWGNPFIVSERMGAGKSIGGCYFAVPTLDDAIACFREFMEMHPEKIEKAKAELAGKNLACWCDHNQQCHADVLLEIANADRSEQLPLAHGKTRSQNAGAS